MYEYSNCSISLSTIGIVSAFKCIHCNEYEVVCHCKVFQASRNLNGPQSYTGDKNRSLTNTIGHDGLIYIDFIKNDVISS